jgi:hypothetical protein
MGLAMFGPYRLATVLSRGPSATVYRAHDTSHHDREVALKVFSRQLSADPAFRERFRRDAGLLSALREPHVVPIHRYGEIDGALYLDMRFVRGPSLADLQRDGPLPPARATVIAQQIAAATGSLLQGGLGNRPLQPSDVLLSGTAGRSEFVQLVGLGLGRPSAPGAVSVPPAALVQPPSGRGPRPVRRRRLLLAATATVAVVAAVLATVVVVRGALTGQPADTGAPGLVATIAAPLSALADVDVVTHDGRPVLVAATADGSVHAWDVGTGHEMHPTIVGAAAAVATTVLDGRTVVVARNRDATVAVHDLSTGTPVGPTLGGPRPVDPGAIASWGGLDTVELDGTSVYVTTMPTGAQVPGAYGPGTEPQVGLQVLALPSGTPVGPVLAEDGHSIGGFSITEIDGRPVAVCIAGRSAVLARDLATGARVGVPTPRQPTGFLALVTAVRGDTPVVVTGGDDNTVRIWNLRTGEQVGQPLVGHTEAVAGLAVIRQGDRAVVVSSSGAYPDGVKPELRFWDLATGAQLGAPLVGHPLARGFAAADGEKALLVAAPAGEPITVWEAEQLLQEVTS